MSASKSTEVASGRARLSTMLHEIQSKIEEAKDSASALLGSSSHFSPPDILVDNIKTLLGVTNQTLKTALAFTERLEKSLEQAQHPTRPQPEAPAGPGHRET